MNIVRQGALVGDCCKCTLVAPLCRLNSLRSEIIAQGSRFKSTLIVAKCIYRLIVIIPYVREVVTHFIW